MGRLKKKSIIYILALILAILQLIFYKDNPLPIALTNPTDIPTSNITITPYAKQKVKVIRVIDGDTIEIEGNIKIRYIGINTPEIYHDTTGKKTGEQCFANESYLENKRLVEGKTITIVKDISDTDKYGRLLRYVYIDDIFVNDYLIKNGFAKLMTIKPDIKYNLQFKDTQIKAKENNLGIWNSCPTKK